MSDPVSPYIASISAPYVEARDRLVALTDGLSHEDFNRKPSEKAWSAGECVVHLNKTARGYLPVFEEVASRDGPRGEGPFAYGFVARRFIEAIRPGSRAIPTFDAIKPPASTGPRSEIDPDRALEGFHRDTARYLACLEEADGLDLGAIRIRSPLLRLMKLPAGAFMEAMGLHSLRHVLQAERAVAGG